MQTKKRIVALDMETFQEYGKIPRAVFSSWCENLEQVEKLAGKDCTKEQCKFISHHIGYSIERAWFAPIDAIIFVKLSGKRYVPS
jgi:hypothetical protein